MVISDKILKVIAKILIVVGFCIIFTILSWVSVAGSWSKTPAIIQSWGHLLNTLSALPFVGGLSLILWGVFLAPGLILLTIVDRKQSKSSPNINKLSETNSFTVEVDDNFHFMDESESYTSGEFNTQQEAILKCKTIIDRYWEGAYQEGMTAQELYSSWVSFGESPFITGLKFNSTEYAKISSKEFVNLKNSELNGYDIGYSVFEEEVERKYEKLLKNAEIIEDDEVIYFCSGSGHCLVAGWNKSCRNWHTSIARSKLNGLSFSSPKRFEETVFGQFDGIEAVNQKQFLIEYLLNGIPEGEIKRVSTELEAAGLVEFSFDWLSWNKMLIGDEIGIIDGLCKYWVDKDKKEEILKYTFACKHWNVLFDIEFISGDFEQKVMSVKEFKNYYN